MGIYSAYRRIEIDDVIQSDHWPEAHDITYMKGNKQMTEDTPFDVLSDEEIEARTAEYRAALEAENTPKRSIIDEALDGYANVDRDVLRDIYIKANNLLSPKVWIKGYAAKTESGVATHPSDSAAVFFCATGSVEHIAAAADDANIYGPALNVLDAIAEEEYGTGIVGVNDEIGYGETKHVFARAIAELS